MKRPAVAADAYHGATEAAGQREVAYWKRPPAARHPTCVAYKLSASAIAG
jgi:hypothetical protein